MKNIIIICILCTSILGMAQQSYYPIDNTRYPFSCRGSYWAFIQFDGFGKAPKALHLHDVSRNGEMQLFKLELLQNGSPAETRISQTPVLLSLTAKEGNASVCFQSADVVRIKGEKCGMKLSYPKQADVVPVNKNEFRMLISSNRIVFSLIKGKYNIDQKETGKIDTRLKHTDAAPTDITIIISPDENGNFEFALTRYISEYAPVSFSGNFTECVSDRIAEFNAFYAPVSARAADSKEVQLAAYLDWASIVNPSGHFKREGMIMSKTWMNGLWSWDHCFNAIAMSYVHPDIAWDQLMVMFDVQDELGALPDAIYINNLQWGHLKIPMHGWTLNKMMKNAPEFFTRDRLNEIYPKLSKWTNFWFTYRDDDKNGIVQVNHGNDDFDWLPVFDAGFPLEDPQVNTMLVFQMETLAGIAEKLGKTEDAAAWAKKAKDLTQKIIGRFWNGEKFIYKVSGTEKHTENSICVLQYTPMLLGNRLPADIRKKLVESFRKSELMTVNGVLTESRKSPLFDADTYTRGSIWPPLNYFIIEGLKACGENKMAEKLTENFISVLNRSGYSERMNPFTGEPWSDPSYTWSSSVYLILKYKK